MDRSLTTIAVALALSGFAFAAPAAELYRWVDENGVVNYSNTPPPKTRTGKAPTVVEDRVSVYTPDKTVTEAVERGRERRLQAPAQPAASFTREPEPERRASAPPPPPPVAYDPCSNQIDPNCQLFLYDGAPVFHGRRRPPRLNQPQIPAGTLAGQATGANGYIAGQSGNAVPAAPPAWSSGSAGFTVRQPERDRDRPRERHHDYPRR